MWPTFPRLPPEQQSLNRRFARLGAVGGHLKALGGWGTRRLPPLISPSSGDDYSRARPRRRLGVDVEE